jgi:hypothetical protein
VRAGENVCPNLDALELFFGEATDAEARVYARLPYDGPLDGWRLTGTLTGPECRFAQTLPATFEFHDLGPGQDLLAEAIVTEPCFWTPDLPFLYRCSVGVPPLGGFVARVAGAGGAADAPVYSSRSVAMTPYAEDGSYSVASSRRSVRSTLVERLFGIRRLGAVGRSLYLDGKRWVARGVSRDRADISDLAAAREASAVLRVSSPDDAFCLEASLLGVPLFVDLHVDEARLLPEVRRLGQWPAVFAIILDPATPIGPTHRAAARNTLFAVQLRPALVARRVSEGRTSRNPPAPLRLCVGLPGAPDTAEQCRPAALPYWAQLAVFRVDSIETFRETARDCTIPILAVRQSEGNLSLTEARAACDRLQFDVAPIGQFSGYFV